MQGATSDCETARQLDAAGRHDDAVNLFARAAQRGDGAALTELGVRLVSGDRAPCLPDEGVRLLYDGLHAGQGDAAARRAAGKLERARVYDSVGGADVVHETRTNTEARFALGDVDVVQAVLQMRMAAVCGVSPRALEAPAVLHYAPGEEIREHFDFVDPAVPDYRQALARHGERVITFLVYLNHDYVGGETDFPRLGVRHKGRRGEGLYFVNALPGGGPDRRMLHAGRAPLDGEKWIVSQFVRDRAVLPAPTAH
jgi:hypothetical protein